MINIKDIFYWFFFIVSILFLILEIVNPILSIVAIIIWLFILLQWWDYLVDWSGSIAKIKKIPPIVIWLTIISFGTSAPEFFVNVLAAIKWQTDLLISNIIGSNLSNLLLILGLAAIIAWWLKVNNNTLYREIPFSFLAVLILLILSNDLLIDWLDWKVLWFELSNYISRIDWLILLSFFIIFLYYVFSISKNWDINWLEDINQYWWLKSLSYVILWILWLYIWGELIVNNAKLLAEKIGISQILIWSTIVAIWTSLPELVATIIAAIKKQTDMAVGNIIWSNIFNIFWIWWASSIIKPVWVEMSLNIDMIILLIATFIVFISIYVTKEKKVTSIIWFLLIWLYIGYLFFTILRW